VTIPNLHAHSSFPKEEETFQSSKNGPSAILGENATTSFFED